MLKMVVIYGFLFVLVVLTRSSTAGVDSDGSVREPFASEKMGKQNTKLSNLLTAMEITAENCAEEVHNLRQELFPLQPASNQLPTSPTFDAEILENSTISQSDCLMNSSTCSLESSYLMLDQRLRYTNKLLLQLQAENVLLKQLHQKSLERFDTECNQTNLVQSIRETVRSTICAASKPASVDNQFLRPCYGKVFRSRISGKSEPLAQITLLDRLTNAPDGILCISNSKNPSPASNFLVFNKTGSSMLFLGTESLYTPFRLFTPYVNFTVPFTTEVTTCINGTSKIPVELLGTMRSDDVYVRLSRNVNKKDCFYIGWLVDNDGTVIHTWLADDMTLWY